MTPEKDQEATKTEQGRSKLKLKLKRLYPSIQN